MQVDDTRANRSFRTAEYVCVSVFSIFHSSHFMDEYDERTKERTKVLLSHLLIKSGYSSFFCIVK